MATDGSEQRQVDPVRPEGLFEGINLRAIGIGVLVDHVSSLVFFTLLVAILGGEQLLSGDEDAIAAAFEALAGSTQYLVTALLGGLICTVLAAFVGARRAGVHQVRHGAWIAFASVAVAVVLNPGDLTGGTSGPEAAGWLLQLPAGLLGGALARWSAEAADRSADDPLS